MQQTSARFFIENFSHVFLLQSGHLKAPVFAGFLAFASSITPVLHFLHFLQFHHFTPKISICVLSISRYMRTLRTKVRMSLNPLFTWVLEDKLFWRFHFLENENWSSHEY